MSTLIQKFEKEKIEHLTSGKRIPAFRAGDTIKVTVKISEGERSRLQAFEGVCISRKNNSINSKFTVRKISHGEGVERVFPLFSPIIDKIEVIRKGNVNRAKLYYLRSRKGKSARISDRDRGEEVDEYSLKEIKEEIENDNSTNTEQSSGENLDISKENIKKETSTEKINQSVEEKEKTIEDKSESIASKAEKTLDEQKI